MDFSDLALVPILPTKKPQKVSPHAFHRWVRRRSMLSLQVWSYCCCNCAHPHHLCYSVTQHQSTLY